MADPKAPRREPPKKAAGPSTDELLRRWEADKKSRIFLHLAEEYRKQDYIDSALSVLREGLKHNPGYQPAHVSLARCLMAKRQHAEAQAELERVLAKAPDNTLAGKLLAQVLEARGERAKALQVLKRLVPFAPDDEEIAGRISDLGQATSPPMPRASAAHHESGETGEYLTGEFDTGTSDRAAMTGRPADPTARPQSPVGAPGQSPKVLDDATADDADAFVVIDGGDDADSGEASAAFEADAPTLRLEVGAFDDLLGSRQAADAAAAAPESEDDFTSVTLAELYESQGAHGEALTLYERLLARKPDDAEIQRAAARCRARVAGEEVAVPAAALTAPPRPRWQPVRPRAATPAPPLATASLRSELAAPAAVGAGAGPPAELSDDGARRLAIELRRWLDAVRAVRQ